MRETENRNPNDETRNKFECQNVKSSSALAIVGSNFEFVSNFDFRYSDFAVAGSSGGRKAARRASRASSCLSTSSSARLCADFLR